MDIALFKAHKLNPDESSVLSSDYIFGWSYVEDAKSRDYTMNALYLQLFPTPMLIYPLGRGKEDAMSKTLRLACPEVFASDLGGQFRFWKTFISKEFKFSTEEAFSLDEEVDELICDHVLWLMNFAVKVEEEKNVKKQEARQEEDSRRQDKGKEKEGGGKGKEARQEEDQEAGRQQGQKNQFTTELLNKLEEMKPETPKLRKVLVESLKKKQEEWELQISKYQDELLKEPKKQKQWRDEGKKLVAKYAHLGVLSSSQAAVSLCSSYYRVQSSSCICNSCAC